MDTLKNWLADAGDIVAAYPKTSAVVLSVLAVALFLAVVI